MMSVLLKFSQQSPLETLAAMCAKYEAKEAATTTFSAYEEFLAILDDEGSRERLSKLKVADALSDATFIRAKKAAADFQTGISKLFFDTDPDLTAATQKYGVF